MSPSVRVPITQGRLDPVRPAALSRYMTPQDWEALAEEITQALSPALSFQTCCSYTEAILTVACLSAFGSAFLLGPGAFVFFFIAFFASLLAKICLVLYRRCCLEGTVDQKLQQVLQDFAQTSKGGITFHVFQESDESAFLDVNHRRRTRVTKSLTDYVLEISIDEERMDAYRLILPTNDLDHTVMSQKAPEDHWTSLQIQTRLQKLEELRSSLTADEYQSKRSEILSHV